MKRTSRIVTLLAASGVLSVTAAVQLDSTPKAQVTVFSPKAKTKLAKMCPGGKAKSIKAGPNQIKVTCQDGAIVRLAIGG